jgi:hypothetical protein
MRQAAAPVAFLFFTSRKAMHEEFEERLAKIERLQSTPRWTWPEDAMVPLRTANLTGAVQDAPMLVDFDFSLIQMLQPTLDRIADSPTVSVARVASTRAAIACERYRRAHGSYPDALQALVPEFLSSVPVDHWDGQPLRYAVRDGAAILWSVGPDRADDGGHMIEELSGNPWTWRPPNAALLDYQGRPLPSTDVVLWTLPPRS